MFKIGIVGYSANKFDKTLAKSLLSLAIDIVIESHAEKEKKIMIVSGLTNIGIPAIAYALANKNGWKTKGVACKLAEDYECFPVDEKVIVGNNWGDESEEFLNSIDVLIRIGGGDQSHNEVNLARSIKIPVYEYDLPKNEKK